MEKQYASDAGTCIAMVINGVFSSVEERIAKEQPHISHALLEVLTGARGIATDLKKHAIPKVKKGKGSTKESPVRATSSAAAIFNNSPYMGCYNITNEPIVGRGQIKVVFDNDRYVVALVDTRNERIPDSKINYYEAELYLLELKVDPSKFIGSSASAPTYEAPVQQEYDGF